MSEIKIYTIYRERKSVRKRFLYFFPICKTTQDVIDDRKHRYDKTKGSRRIRLKKGKIGR